MLKTWSLFQKLVLSNVLYSIPVLALIYMMVQAQDVNIDFAYQEEKGNELQRPIETLLKPLLQYRMDLSLDEKKPVPAEIASAIEGLKPSMKKLAGDLQFTDEELKKRNRSGSRLEDFEKRWLEFAKAGESKGASEKVNGFITDVRTMITHTGDTSFLILDPDLDSYYLMDVTLVALPQVQDRISEVLAFLSSHRKSFSGEDKIQAAVYAALLKQSDLDRITGDLQTALNEDPNFYGVSPTLKEKLSPEIAKLQAKLELFIDDLTKLSAGKSPRPYTEVAKAATEAFELSFGSWIVAVNELDALLAKRTSVLNAQKVKSLVIALAALLLAVAILGWISSSFNRNMKTVIDRLRSAVSRTQTSGSELVTLSADLSSCSDEQASALQQTSAAIEEINSMVQSTVSNTEVARDTAHKSHESANSGKQAVDHLLTAIGEISNSNQLVLDQVETSRKEMLEITKIIGEIGGKTRVINDIVFETKLLSFNASVEAARAGEAGKGFAVVAEEVGNLAQMSGNASKEIASMLDSSVTRVKTISSETDTKVSSLSELSRKNLNQGADLAEECNTAIKQILERIQDVLDNADRIQTAAGEQAKGIQEVTSAIHKLDTIAQKNMDMSKKTSVQSQEVAEQAKDLESVVQLVQAEVLGASHADFKH